eukprot:CAMPEP_0206630430 /NCGR_PEP_ID=MMETSP0325_2-20121206/67566_1 /ASSEMBLY_ACC=CAM_ASM_000347 /TAXON_ID=2866 /ORGANISM="Crypthecodinium cohnii, Strain Seligo" /LENGTH=62 /DNA_ID=CAMNT_0054155283 /DNA_START=300 /DNA_END=488 /DNA_ORIENTATION=-
METNMLTIPINSVSWNILRRNFLVSCSKAKSSSAGDPPTSAEAEVPSVMPPRRGFCTSPLRA